MTKKIAVIGLGYVGAPLAEALAENYHVFGIDVDHKKLENLEREGISYPTYDCLDNVPDVDIYIVTVPTPIGINNLPDLTYVTNATLQIAGHISKKAIIVYESTVYPGTTENICEQVFEAKFNMRLGIDYQIGYSPERIDPGNNVNTLRNTNKLLAASDTEALISLREIYQSVVNEASIIDVPSIKACEAAKLLENVQRDVNIAVINEYSNVMKSIDVNIYDVLEAAGTKWNFHKYKPGLVGGHCIGVDPYYFIHLAKKFGIDSGVIKTARDVNECQSDIVSTVLQDYVRDEKINSIVFLGATFKPDVSDARNSQAIKIIKRLRPYCSSIMVLDRFLESSDRYDFHIIRKIPELNKDQLFVELVEHSYHNSSDFTEQLSKVKFISLKDLLSKSYQHLVR